MTPNPPITDPEEPKLNGIYPIALNKLVANNFRLIGDLQAAQNGFGRARLSFIPG